jgi:hypothetical protein
MMRTRRIKLIVTGDMEQGAIVPSLKRIFHDGTGGLSVEYLRPRQVMSFTSTPLRSPIPREIKPRLSVIKLARAVIDEALDGADLVIALDDLELANAEQPHIVVEWVRRAVQDDIERRASSLGSASERQLRESIQSRCSFHLFVPMTEAYFFGGDRDPIERIAPGSRPRLVRSDVEDFETDDPGYAQAVACENERRWALGHRWWHHERHPKHYLEHLAWKSGTEYHETTNGQDALKEIDWKRVPPDGNSVRFLRSLFRDLADFFGVESPLGPGEPSPHTYPDRTADRGALVLRNI